MCVCVCVCVCVYICTHSLAYIYIYIYTDPQDEWVECSPMSRETDDSKIVLDAALLNTQQYKVRIKSKVH